MSIGLLVSAWLVGAAGGLHCVAMCGGLVAATSARDRSPHPLVALRSIVSGQLAYQTGRIATYALLGAAFGAAGALSLGVAAGPVQRLLYLAANVFLLLIGVRILSGTAAFAPLQRAGARAFAPLLVLARPLLRRRGLAGRVTLGLVWGLSPCALVYSVLPLALFAGGAWQGGAVMMAFGIGTLPNLLAAGLFFERAQWLLRGASLRYAAASVLIAFALLGVWRVLVAPDTLAQGAFCLVP